MWNCFFPKKMTSFIFMKKVVFTRFFSYTTLIWGSGDYWMGKQIQFIWLVRRRGGVGIRSWIYILQTTQQYSSKWLVWFPGQEDVGVDRLQAVLLELLLCLNQHQVNNRLLFRARNPLSEGFQSPLIFEYFIVIEIKERIEWLQSIEKKVNKILTNFCKGGSSSVPSWASNQPLGQVGKVRWTDN